MEEAPTSGYGQIGRTAELWGCTIGHRAESIPPIGQSGETSPKWIQLMSPLYYVYYYTSTTYSRGNCIFFAAPPPTLHDLLRHPPVFAEYPIRNLTEKLLHYLLLLLVHYSTTLGNGLLLSTFSFHFLVALGSLKLLTLSVRNIWVCVCVIRNKREEDELSFACQELRSTSSSIER